MLDRLSVLKTISWVKDGATFAFCIVCVDGTVVPKTLALLPKVWCVLFVGVLGLHSTIAEGELRLLFRRTLQPTL